MMTAKHAGSVAPSAAVPVTRTGRLILVLALTAIGATGCGRPGGEAPALSERLSRVAGTHCQKEIAISVGSIPFTLLRAGLALAEPEPEVKAALGALRGAEVAVYELRPGRRAPDQSALLVAADETMTERGWDRVVGVLSPEELVAVYVPADLTSTRNVRVCAVVFDGRELVVASVRGNPEPLMHLALAQIEQAQP